MELKFKYSKSYFRDKKIEDLKTSIKMNCFPFYKITEKHEKLKLKMFFTTWGVALSLIHI